MQGWFVSSELIIDETCQEMRKGIDRATMPMMNEGAQRLERGKDGLNEASFMTHGLIFQ